MGTASKRPTLLVASLLPGSSALRLLLVDLPSVVCTTTVVGAHHSGHMYVCVLRRPATATVVLPFLFLPSSVRPLPH